MFHIKICGIRLIEDLVAVEQSAADAIGLNFFQPSVRYVNPQSSGTAEIACRAGSLGLLRVGVFVNATIAEITQISKLIELDAVQLHGDETAEIVGRLFDAVGLPIIRAIKLPTTATSTTAIDAKAAPWIEADCQLLFDADAGAAHGGSGKTLHWPSIRTWSDAHPGVPWTLAGGLNPENVSEAIRVSGARSVDTASGVESSRGVKSAALIAQFAAAAQ